MKKIRLAIASLILFFLGIILQQISSLHPIEAQMQSVPLRQKPEYKKGELLIKVVDGTDISASISEDKNKTGPLQTSLEDNLKKRGALKISKLLKSSSTQKQAINNISKSLNNVYVATYDSSEDILKKAKEISTLPHIVYAEPNYMYQLTYIPNDPYYLDSYPSQQSSRDAFWDPPYDYQWNMKKINMAQAWDNEEAASITVAVIDTGVDYTNPQLGGCSLEQVQNDNCPRVVSGYDMVNNDVDPMDDYGHGTHVAGIIASQTDDGIGMAGMSQYARVMPIKALNHAGQGYVDQLANGIAYAAEHNARVINASWGGVGQSITLRDAISYAQELDVLFVASAGNDNSEVSQYFPANINCATVTNPDNDCTVTVSSTNRQDGKSSFSNKGVGIDIAAPGGDGEYNIISLKSTVLYPNLNFYSVGPLHLRLSGTSMAAPHVAGLAAMIIGKNSDLTSLQVRNIIMNSADDLGTPSYDTVFGHGRINAGRALIDMDITQPLTSRIGKPFNSFPTSAIFSIEGSAYGQDFINYVIEYADSATSSEWSSEGISLINNGTSQVHNATLGTADLSHLINKKYYIRLRVVGANDQSVYTISPIRLDKSIRPHFPVSFGSNVINMKPAIADINNDGKQEILYKNYIDGTFHATGENGQSLPGWPISYDPFYTRSRATSSPIATDLDVLYPGLETLYPYSPGFGMVMLAFHADGTPVPGWTYPDWEPKQLGYVGDTASVGKINNQWALIYPETDQYLFARDLQMHTFNKNGQLYPGFPINSASNPSFFITPMSVDLNKDGKNEIITGLYTLDGAKNRIKIYKENGTIYKDININEQIENIVVADLEQDGFYEIIVTVNNTATLTGVKRVYVYTYQGNMRTKWPYNLPNSAWEVSLVTVGDFTGDGNAEILIHQADITGYGKEYILLDRNATVIKRFNDTGRPLWGVNATLANGNHIWATTNYSSVGAGVILQEYNKTTNTFINAPGFPKAYQFSTDDIPALTTAGMAALADLDNDGKVELITTVTDGEIYDEFNSFIYVYNTDYEVAHYDWPQYRHDSERTGVYKPAVVIPTPTPTGPVVTPTRTPTPSRTPTPTGTPTPTPLPGNAPDVHIDAPEDGTTLPNSSGYTVLVTASDVQGIAEINIYIDGGITSVKTCKNVNSCSFWWTISSLSSGSHVIRAEAKDRGGAMGFDQNTVIKN